MFLVNTIILKHIVGNGRTLLLHYFLYTYYFTFLVLQFQVIDTYSQAIVSTTTIPPRAAHIGLPNGIPKSNA